MGGDDLGSDDEFLAAPLKSAVVGHDDPSDDEDDDDDFSVEGGLVKTWKEEAAAAAVVVVNDVVPGNNKRKQDSDTGRQQSSSSSSPQRKRSKKDRTGGPLRSLGTRILEESASSQAELLSQLANVKFSPHHIAKPLSRAGSNSSSNNFMDRLLCLISKKQLKKTLTKKSPRAIVVCLSARRCVAVLKDLAPLRLRVAKLFPKQGSIEEQAKQLESSDFGLAVGTPHRIKELMERGNNCLSLSGGGTVLFGLDVYENDKSFSVYTMADTSPPTIDLLKDHLHPQLMFNDSKNGKRGGELKVAFV